MKTLLALLAVPLLALAGKKQLTDFARGVYSGQCSKFCLDDGNSSGGWDPRTDECVCQTRYKRKDVIQQRLFLMQPRVKIDPPSEEHHNYYTPAKQPAWFNLLKDSNEQENSNNWRHPRMHR